MIKRTTKLKPNTSRSGFQKAAPTKAEPKKADIATLAASRSERPKVQTQSLELLPASPVKSAPARAESPKARLELLKPEAQAVFVAGSFNNWNPTKTPLRRSADGKWVGELSGISGRHEYLFVVDGQWLPDPNARENVQNPFGGRNSVLVVTGQE